MTHRSARQKGQERANKDKATRRQGEKVATQTQGLPAGRPAFHYYYYARILWREQILLHLRTAIATRTTTTVIARGCHGNEAPTLTLTLASTLTLTSPPMPTSHPSSNKGGVWKYLSAAAAHIRHSRRIDKILKRCQTFDMTSKTAVDVWESDYTIQHSTRLTS